MSDSKKTQNGGSICPTRKKTKKITQKNQKQNKKKVKDYKNPSVLHSILKLPQYHQKHGKVAFLLQFQ